LVVFTAVSLTIPMLDPFLRRGDGLGSSLLLACYQFTIEGLAPLSLMLWRRETIADFGLRRPALGRSTALAFVLTTVYDAGMSLAAGQLQWIPLRRQPATRMSLRARFPAIIPGLMATILVWGAIVRAQG
jgi:hypothetical protein